VLADWARCRSAYGPADPTATHCLLLQENQTGFGFTFLVMTHPGSPRQNPESRSSSSSSSFLTNTFQQFHV